MPKQSSKAIVAFTLAVIAFAYVLPIVISSLYLKIYNPYESGLGWIIFGLVALGFVVVPVLSIVSIIFAIIALSNKLGRKNLAVASLALIGLMVLMILLSMIVLSS